MKDVLIDSATALDLLRRAVEEKGRDYVPKVPPVDPKGGTYVDDFLVAGCYYRDPAEFKPENTVQGIPLTTAPVPVCGVGFTFHYLGILDRIPDRHINAEPISSTDFNLPGVTFTPKARRVLSAFQSKQDGGSTWGYALEWAEGVARNTRLKD